MPKTEFDTRAATKVLQSILKRYEENESLHMYDESCYIEDILFFLGKSVDMDKYGCDARSYRRFIAQKIAPFSGRIAKAVFTDKLKRGE